MAVLLGALVLLGVLGTASPAAAHAALTGSSPAEGSVVRDAPRQVTLTFSEGVAMSDGAIRVLDPRGKRVDTGTIRDTGKGGKVQRTAPLKAGLAKGTYTVAWQAVSADSHPVSGAFTFSVGAPSKTTATVPGQDKDAGGGAVGTLYGAGRYAAYAGFILLVGGAAFVLACSPRAASAKAVRRLTVTGWVTLAASTLMLLLLRGPYTTSGQLGDVFDLGGLKDVVATKPGAALVSRLLLLAAAALFVSVLFGTYARRRAEDGDERESEIEEKGKSGGKASGGKGSGAEAGGEGSGGEEAARAGRDLFYGLAVGGTVVAAGLAATWAMAEHASTGIQTALAMPVDILHLLAVALWLGGLTSLFALLRWGPAPTAETVRRFSRLAFTSVTVLALSGLYQSWRQVGSWSALTGTSYGQLLLVKIGLVALLVGIGWISRRWTARLTETAPPRASGAPSGASAASSSSAASVPDQAGHERGHARVTAGASARTGAAPRDGASPGREEAEERTPADPVRAAQLARQRAAANAERRRQQRDADPGRSGLRRSVLTEAAIAVVLLAITTILTSTEPGRTEEAARAAGSAAGQGQGQGQAPAGPVDLSIPFDTGGPNGKGTADLEIDPGTSGDNTLDLRTTSPSGTPVEAPEVKVALTLPAKDIGPLPITPKPVKDEKGHWRATGVQLPMAGKWKIAVTVRTSDIDMVTETKTATIG
ncbi:copper resistance protein CopC [Streptomyces iconiensis]|uniref:Copper resistance protein CopC n=1 Tax=Streptomyces iconiensis TaxID=1384038 RepID=A0ABT7A4A0_9ACTN|nr:copper resistance protein CopC [Streptomyces iconiensis]MDJ1136173.1 copper resistance protein CopC [Streptomyces iconiensis]